MLKFSELRVFRGHLLITVEVQQIENYYDNVYINSIKIDTQDTFKSTGPSGNLIYQTTAPEGSKKFTLDLQARDFNSSINMSKTMFFVYAEPTGIPDPSTPCGLDNAVTLGVTFDKCPILNQTMAYVKEVNNTCEIPNGFINMILQYKAIQYAIDSGHFEEAIKFYNKFYGKITNRTFNKCKCNG